MEDANRTESPEQRRRGRRRNAEEPPETSARPSARIEGDDRANPQPPADALQKDPSPSAASDDGARFDRVRQRAYELYVKRGQGGSDDVADWLEAERQIDSERTR